ncbi:unnamed protein product, partial [Nesidiocoris tenuis]
SPRLGQDWKSDDPSTPSHFPGFDCYGCNRRSDDQVSSGTCHPWKRREAKKCRCSTAARANV